MSTFDRQNLKKSPRLGLRVSDHALIRFRERVEEEFLCRSDDDLADLLNERIRAAILSREVVDPREPSKPTTLHMFECRNSARLVAVVRERCVVTVLEDWMARSNYPGWEDGTLPAPLGSPFADKLKALAIVPTSPVVTPTPSVSPAPAPIAPPDTYAALVVECRVLGQQVRALREQRDAVVKEYDEKVEAAVKEYEEKRGRLLAILDEGAPS